VSVIDLLMPPTDRPALLILQPMQTKFEQLAAEPRNQFDLK
jgi:hypothetical protein